MSSEFKQPGVNKNTLSTILQLSHPPTSQLDDIISLYTQYPSWARGWEGGLKGAGRGVSDPV